MVARLEYDPQDPTTAWVTVAVDEGNRVAVLADDGGEVTAGPPLAELVAALAQECQGVVTFAEESARALPPGEGDEKEDDDPFDPQIGIAVVADRAVVCTTADHAGLERLATEAETTLHAVPTETGHTLLVEDGPAVGDLPLAELQAPALVLQQAADYPALGVAGDEEYQYVWGLQQAVVPLQAVAAEEFADRHLGTGALVDQVMAAVPGGAAGPLREAIESGAGPVDVLPALGLGADVTEQLTEFLTGRRSAEDVAGVATIEPVALGEAMRRRAQEAADDARRAADDTRRRAQLAAEDARRMADEARASAAAFADAAEEPVRTWAPWAAAGADVLVGALLWRRSGRAHRSGLPMGAGAKVVRGVSVLLFAAAAANVAGAVLDARRRTQR